MKEKKICPWCEKEVEWEVKEGVVVTHRGTYHASCLIEAEKNTVVHTESYVRPKKEG